MAVTEPRSAVRAVEEFFARITGLDDPSIFVAVAAAERALEMARSIDERDAVTAPLRGSVFAVKDNIDVAGLPTTAGCPAFAYEPSESAPVVAQLVDSGAVPVAKTNLDQFATGLVGTRSPHGTPRNPHDPGHVPGGSSSGSAVAVARELVDFALGTDTAGSGRVPAAFCAVVGLKPTVGRLSGRGVVPAVRSVDCVSILAPDLATARSVLDAAARFDRADPYARRAVPVSTPAPSSMRIGVAAAPVLKELGADDATIDGYRRATDSLAAVAGTVHEVDVQPFLDAGELLYEGPLLAERFAAVGDFIVANAEAVDPTVAAIITGGRHYDSVETHRAAYRLAELRRRVELTYDEIDVLVLPTVPHGARIDEVVADPLGVNERLGRFTTFANLVDLCAVSMPAGPRSDDGLPFGVTLYGPAWHEQMLLTLGAAMVGEALPPASDPEPEAVLAVAGAHLRGQPLEHQLTDLGARFLTTTTTAPTYRLFALADATPAKPALVHAVDGASIEVDLWGLDEAALGHFVGLVPAPLAIGTVTLADGSACTGFVAEPRALDGATDITHLGGWRSYVDALLATTDGSR